VPDTATPTTPTPIIVPAGVEGQRLGGVIYFRPESEP